MAQQEVTIMQKFSGPLPAPADLESYDKIVPGAAERILSMAEKEQATRLENARKSQDANIVLAKSGQWMGMILAVLFAAMSVLFALWGYDKLAMVVCVPLIVWVCSIFVLRKLPQNK